MSMDTFLQLEVMLPYEEMLEKGPSRPPKTTQHPFLSRLGLCGALLPPQVNLGPLYRCGKSI